MCPHNLANADRGGTEVMYLPIPEVEVAAMDLASAMQKAGGHLVPPLLGLWSVYRDAIAECATMRALWSLEPMWIHHPSSRKSRWNDYRTALASTGLQMHGRVDLLDQLFWHIALGPRVASATKRFKCSSGLTLIGGAASRKVLASNATARTRWSS